jgi:Fic family protein
LIREFDAREGWSNGFRTCAHWLNWRVGLDLGAARERVRVARTLGTLPLLAQALARGELSYAKVRALTRVATRETEERLLAVGRAGTAEHVERIVRGWRRVDRQAEAREAAQRHKSRALHVYQDADGMVVIRGRLEPEVGVLLMQAVAAAREALYLDRSPADLREVANYVAALEYGLKRLKTLPLSLSLTRELHSKLMTGVRGDDATPGEFRKSQHWIGPPGATISNAVYVPPPPGALRDCLGAWENFLHDRSLPVLVQTALMHVQFEAIHPFLDGNGRVGRLLITLFLVERDVLPTPLLYLSAFFEATRADYYDRLQAVHARGEWDEWLVYFLNGVARQSQDALSRAARINALVARWRAELAGSSQPARRLVELVAENPYCTIRRVEQRLKVAFTTAQRAVERLQSAGILKQVNQARRDRVYCAAALLKILEEPARLEPTEAT